MAARLPSRPRVLQQDPSTLRRDARGRDPARRGGRDRPARPTSCAASWRGGWRRSSAAVAGASQPRVIALEWLDPPYVGGHWIPEMISIAGGEDVAGPPGPEVARGLAGGSSSGLNPDVVDRDALRLVRRGLPRPGARALGPDRGARRQPRLRGRRGLDLLPPRPAPGRRRRAARPPPSPGPGRRAGQHRLRRAALRRRASGCRRRETTPISAPSPPSRPAKRRGPSMPRSPARIASPQSRPPARPPRWPPRLMLADAEGERQVDQQHEAELRRRSRSKPRPRAITKVAPKMPKIAPEAPTVTWPGSVERQRPEGAGEAARRSRARGSAACRSPARAAGRGSRGRTC